MSPFAERLKYAMGQANMSQREPAKTIGASPAAISQYLKGSIEPRRNRAKIIAKGLEVSEAWLMGYDVPMKIKRRS
nr:MAG TPA: bifunctional HTH-domain containing protein/aminotransferase [Caudoviricetes sp.]